MPNYVCVHVFLTLLFYPTQTQNDLIDVADRFVMNYLQYTQ